MKHKSSSVRFVSQHCRRLSISRLRCLAIAIMLSAGVFVLPSLATAQNYKILPVDEGLDG